MSRDIMDFYCRNAPFQEMLQERAGGSEEIHDVLLARRGCAFEQSWERRRLRVLSPVDGAERTFCPGRMAVTGARSPDSRRIARRRRPTS